MSSHREAPEISKDPVADSTDVYAFVSPDKPGTVTLIANYIPLQGPAGGPNFYSFGDDVLYEIHIDNGGNAQDNITYAFHFQTRLRDPNTFLYNVGPIQSLDSANWNRRQLVSVWKTDHHGQQNQLLSDVACPPCNIGPLSTPDYTDLANAAIHDLPNGGKFFAGQRAEAFYVDLGAVFDLADLPGAADTDIAQRDAEELATLQEAFLASPWAGRTPVAVEVPFEMAIGDTVVRGRIDAVFAEPDGGATVVDWKTGEPPHGSEAARHAAIQLGVYRLAWAALSGCRESLVRAAFHYVRTGLTVVPDALPGPEELAELLARGTPS